nr:DUF397 domain-containing protein [Streptomyces chattanoogensis]
MPDARRVPVPEHATRPGPVTQAVEPDRPDAVALLRRWFKSSCSGNGGSCVEIAANLVALRGCRRQRPDVRHLLSHPADGPERRACPRPPAASRPRTHPPQRAGLTS